MGRFGPHGMAFGLLCTLVLSRAAVAQDGYRHTVVVTAGAAPAELGSVARPMTVMTRDDLQMLPAASIADVLRLVPSLDVRVRGLRGAQTDFSARGSGFGQVLVLVDGVRLNDLQSGHHNGDIPVPLDAVERIEVLHGAGSSPFGSDAFGATVNIITRAAHEHVTLAVHGGSFATTGASGSASLRAGEAVAALDGAWDRSGGFIEDRDSNSVVLRSRVGFGATTQISAAVLRKEFGAANFYGGNAPSREWTNGLLVNSSHRLGVRRGWTMDATASYRTHGDRFVFDRRDPARSDNRHRTHAAITRLSGSRRVRGGGHVAAGVEGGLDWIRSTNLGDHGVVRAAGFGEWRQAIGSRVHLEGALRVDTYEEFGTAWNPTFGASWWPRTTLRLRAAAGRAFRVPTFTERYYSDPANLARPEVGPERAWSREAGADLFLPGGWSVQATAFSRSEADVIDWLRPTAAERWRTYNIRDIDVVGLEVGGGRRFASGAFVRAGMTLLDVDAGEVSQLSKYALDYAPRSFVAAGSIPVAAWLRIAPRVEYRRRVRSTGGEEYVLVDVRAAVPISRRVEVLVDGTNLLDRRYQEIGGVPMPGAAMTASLRISAR